MKCPDCGTRAYCIDSRDEAALSTRRRYKCQCGNRFTTLEINQDFDKLLRLPPGSLARKWYIEAKDNWIQTGKEMARKELREYIGII